MAHILVVEDDDNTRAMIRELLEIEQYAVAEVRDGEAALAHLRAHPGPLVVVLDWLLPGLDGIQVLHAVAGDETLARRRAFVLLTATAFTTARPLPPLPAALDVQVMVKPFNLDVFVRAVGDAAARINDPAA